MTTYLYKNVGKKLFPHLARDQRKQLMSKIFLVLSASFVATGSLVMWMIGAIKH